MYANYVERNQKDQIIYAIKKKLRKELEKEKKDRKKDLAKTNYTNIHTMWWSKKKGTKEKVNLLRFKLFFLLRT